MVVTIIGSTNSEACKKWIEQAVLFSRNVLNAKVVHHPLDESLQSRSLLSIQSKYICFIDQADLVIVCPKSIHGETNGGVDQTYRIGESTTYEMATARFLGKPILIWRGMDV